MPRLIMFARKGPYQGTLPDGSKAWFCGCGLSTTYPFCSGRHIHASDEDEEKLYLYTVSGERLGPVREIVLEDGTRISGEEALRLLAKQPGEGKS